MNQQITINHLTYEELVKLYNRVDWDYFAAQIGAQKTYNRFLVVDLLKIHVLPYLLPISSERKLADELSEREPLRKLCGLLEDNPETLPELPTRSTLWFFRDKYKDSFPGVLLNVLALLAYIAYEENIRLPFVSSSDNGEHLNMNKNWEHSSFRYGDLNFDIFGSKLNDNRKGYAVEQLSLPWGTDFTFNKNTISGGKTELGYMIEFPVIMHAINVKTNKQLIRQLIRPYWLKRSYRSLDSDPLSSDLLGPSNVLRSYTACNLIVRRYINNREQILLSKRLSGEGAGEYALPGGKQKLSEVLIQDCAYRELKQETGFKLIKSRPICIYVNKSFSNPNARVISIGILVEQYTGKLRHVECVQTTPWDWFWLDDLPEPIFWPSRQVIDAYIYNTFPDLSWNDIEIQPPLFNMQDYYEN